MSENRLILILEQNAVDASFLERSFQEERICNPARIVRTPERMQCYLKGVGSYRNREVYPLPALLLLDLHYTNSGLDALRWLGAEGYLEKFPVVGIGHSIQDAVVQHAFDLGLSGYFGKPGDLRQLAKMICCLQWVEDLKPKIPDGLEIEIVTRAEFSSRDD
ncbi:MAG: response regulator [Limisphaerales bacterium]